MHSDESKSQFLSALLAFLRNQDVSIDDEESLYGAFDHLADWLASNAANKTMHCQVSMAASLINEFAVQRIAENDHILANELFTTLIGKGGGPVRELIGYLNRDALVQMVTAYSRCVLHLGGKR